ncbi:MAG: response regulator, partial [Flavobacteriales bacterium]|nr:response regulator [Flavobacteriales bacterium]
MNKILWVDDEIELLKPHIIYLESKGYDLCTAKSGDEALDILENNHFNLIFLDENMPGLSGLETLNIIKDKYQIIPVVMITKSEEESIMEDAIGSKISDYLIKPVNPSQILLSIKKNLESSRLVDEKIAKNYQQEFRNISLQLSSSLSINDWYDVYRKIVFWELELSQSRDNSIDEIISMQKSEANSQFFRFIKNNYKNWINDV